MRGNEAIRCILIDDHVEEHEIFSQALKATGLPVICHYYLFADDALQNLYHRVAPEPKLIFLDVNIPRMHGLEFLKKIKAIKRLAHIPVYIYSVSGFDEHVKEALDLGAKAYLIKPDTQKELVSMLTEKLFAFLPEKVKG